MGSFRRAGASRPEHEQACFAVLVAAPGYKDGKAAMNNISILRANCKYTHKLVEGYWVYSSEWEDKIAAASPDARKHAGGSGTMEQRVMRIPEVAAYVKEGKISELTEHLRANLPNPYPPNTPMHELRRTGWSDGDTMRLLDRHMVNQRLYTRDDVEGSRARCFFGELGQDSAANGIDPKRAKGRRSELKARGAASRQGWLQLYAHPETDFSRGMVWTLKITNPDGSTRMQLDGTGPLRFRDQVGPGKDRKYGPGEKAPSAPGTIRHFARAFLVSLFGDDLTNRTLSDQLSNLYRNASSTLFHGHGWEFKYGGEAYSKN